MTIGLMASALAQAVSHFAQATDTNQFSRVVFRNGEFFGLSRTHLSRSKDGIRWQSQSIPIQNITAWDVFIFQGKIWLSFEKNVLSSDDDGLTWTEHAVPRAGPRFVIEQHGRLFATTSFFDGTTGRLYGGHSYSDDGTHWIGQLYEGLASAFVFGAGKFVSISGGFVNVSTNGINYVSIELPRTAIAATFAKGMFVVVGDNITAWSADGISWKTSDFVGRLKTVASNGNLFVALKGSRFNLDDIYSSSDGKSWTLTGSVSIQSLGAETITYGNGIFVIAPTREDGAHYYSYDPSLWISRVMPNAVDIRILGLPATRYSLQMSERYGPSGWKLLRDFQMPNSTEGIVLTIDGLQAPQAFFRLVAQ
jgi:hypothetical protein